MQANDANRKDNVLQVKESENVGAYCLEIVFPQTIVDAFARFLVPEI